MKMPIIANNKVEVKPSTDQGDASKQCLSCLEKKIRNLEKRKGRIEQNQEKAKKGVKLEKEQEDSLQQYDQVMHCLEFALDLQKQFLQINQENEKMAKKQAKREKAEQQATVIKRIREIIQLQALLDLLAADKVREDFKSGNRGAVVLTEANLNQLDELYLAISPSQDDSGDDYPQRLTLAAEHLVNYLDGKDRQVVGTTYKDLKKLISLIVECGYFESARHLETVDTAGKPAQESEQAVATTEEPAIVEVTSSSTEQEQTFDSQQQQSVDLPDPAQSPRDLPTQTLSSLEQDALFALSSLPYQAGTDSHFIQTASPQVPSYPSFTNGPFQFIQASYVMPESTAPGIVDPAVVIAQPAGSSGLQFMSQRYDHQPPHIASQMQKMQTQHHQQHQQQPNHLVDHQPQPSATQQPLEAQQIIQDYNSQTYAQNLQTDSLFAVQGVEVSDTLSSHSNIVGQLREDNMSSSPYEIPPSIPMPPSQPQDQTSDQQQQQQMQEKKFQMNVSAPVFQSMYSQVHPSEIAIGPAIVNTAVPQPPLPAIGEAIVQASATDFSSKPVPSRDFGQSGAGDYQHSSQTNSEFARGVYPRGNHSGFQGGHGGNEASSAGGPGGSLLHNGLPGRSGGTTTNSDLGVQGGAYQGYPPSNNYRPDSFHGTYDNYNKSGFSGGSYQKRGGMNSTGGPGAGVYPRGGAGGNAGRGGIRGGMTRGGNSGPRGTPRGGFNRTLAT